MLRYLIAAASLLVPTTGASAQNAPSWTGFYAGGHLAGSRDRLHATDTLGISQISGLFVTGRGIIIVPNTTRDLDASGHKTNFDWGGQIGYQWQTGHVVLAWRD